MLTRLLIVLALLTIPTIVSAQPSHVQELQKGISGACGASIVTNSATQTSGHLNLVFFRSDGAGAQTTVPTDTLGTTYTLVAKIESGNPYLYVWKGVLGSTGSNAVTLVNDNSGTVQYCWVSANEINLGGGSGAADGTGSNHPGGTVTDLVTSAAVTRANANDILYMAGSDAAFVNYTAGANRAYTLVNGAEGDSNHFGGVEYFVYSSTGSNVEDITQSAGSTSYSVLAVAISGSGGGGGGGGCKARLALLGVGSCG